MAVMDIIKAKAKADKKTIILPESMDERTFKAAAQVLKEGLANIVIIGTPEEIAANKGDADISGATIIDPNTYEKTQAYEDLYVEIRKNKGLTHEEARKMMRSDYGPGAFFVFETC